MFLLFFQILGSFFVILFLRSYITHVYICIYIIHAEYFWLVMAGLKETFYTLILRFVHITFCLLTKPDYVATKGSDGIDFILL